MEKFTHSETLNVLDKEIKHYHHLKCSASTTYRANEYLVALVALQDLRKKLYGEKLELK